MEAVGIDLGGNINYLQDLAVTSDGSNLLDIIDQNVPGYHRVTKTDPFQDPLDDEPFCCMHRQHHLLTSASGAGGAMGSVTSAMCEAVSLDLSPNITEDFQKMYSDWQHHLGSLQDADAESISDFQDADVESISDLLLSVSDYSRDFEASEDEELVVDETVSLSVGKTKPNPTPVPSVVTRQRTESVSSITGPCIPPDLLLDSSRHYVAVNDTCEEETEEDYETVLTEIAGLLDGELAVEAPLIIDEDGTISVPSMGVDGQVINVEIPNDKEQQVLVEEEEEEVLECPADNLLDGIAESLEDTCRVVKSEDSSNGGSFRNVAKLIGNRSDSMVCRKVRLDKISQDQTVQADGPMKLQAGSIVLAVVNESGSLVPLPQLKMKSKNLARSIKVGIPLEKPVEEDIDVETVTEKAPVLEAGDVDSLLAQFEASEAVNTSTINQNNASSIKVEVLPSTTQTWRPNTQKMGIIKAEPTPQVSPTHQRIKDALPKEIIEKIKASTKRKSTQMLSEPMVVRRGRGIRQQEARQLEAMQQRTKNQRTSASASGQQSPNDRVPPPLDHDYCFTPDKQKKGKQTADTNIAPQAEDCLNKIPDYYTVKVSQRGNKTVKSENHDDSGKKDSGVESGDVSDASVETEEGRTKNGQGKENWDKGKCQGNEKCLNEKLIEEDVYNKLPPYMTDIGNSKPKDNEEEEEDEGEPGSKERKEEEQRQQEEVKKIKRKLNLSEYRQRIQSTHSSTCPSPSHGEGGTKVSSHNPLSLGELIQKMKDAEVEKVKEAESGAQGKELSKGAVPAEEIEEGELKGESDSEVLKPAIIQPKTVKAPESGSERKAPFASPSSMTGSTQGSRESRKSSSQGYASRRWSSSSHSRSRSRSPRRSRKHESTRYRRSSRGRRKKTHRSSRASISPYRCSRSRSKSRSHSRSRASSCSSDSSYCSTCTYSSKSRSRSRSRSRSSRKRDRYSRNWNRRSQRSLSRSSSRYSRERRSRSPLWRDSRDSRHSKSPSRRLIRPRRREDQDRVRQVEERRVIYVGRISEGTTKAELRKRFQKYGTIVDISVHFREHGDNYGFVTFKDKGEAYNAVENGNEDPKYPRYDLCFGGRRAFCRVQYSDLDAQDEDSSYTSGLAPGSLAKASGSSDFDSLLRDAMKRKTR